MHDDDLRSQFHRWRTRARARAPGFDAILTRAPAHRIRRGPALVLGVAAAALVAVLLTQALVRDEPVPLDVILAWTPATDVFLPQEGTP